MIEIRNSGRLEIRYTSLPLGLDKGGVYDIHLDDYSSLLFCGGATEFIFIDENATAVLKGGQVNKIRSFQHVDDIGNITIECQSGWSWLGTSSKKTGITGLWADDTAFTINFLNDDTGYYDPTWMNINLVIVPEPATLLLLSAGGLLVRRRK